MSFKILITGARGFVGSNLSRYLHRRGIDCVLHDRSLCDLTDYGQVLRYLQRTKPSVVVHAAGYVGGILRNFKNNAYSLNQNILMGLNIVNACRSAGVEKVINIGSSCMYPRVTEGTLSEDDLFVGQFEPTNAGYGVAKATVALYCKLLRGEFPQLNYITVVPCNLYGPGDNFDLETGHLLANAIMKIHSAKISGNESVEIWGDGTPRREFLFINDFCDFVNKCIKSISLLPPVLNVGVGSDLSVREYYQTVATCLDYTPEWLFNKCLPNGVTSKLLDLSLQREILNWQPTTSLVDGIQETYKYFLDSIHG